MIQNRSAHDPLGPHPAEIVRIQNTPDAEFGTGHKAIVPEHLRRSKNFMKTKKLLAILIAAVMAFALLPASVFAAAIEVSTEAGLTAAVAADGEIKLTADITLTNAVVIAKSVIIDMNGFNIKGNPADKRAFLVNDGGNLNLKNTATTGGRILPGAGLGDASSYDGIRIKAITGIAKATVGSNVSVEAGCAVVILGNGTAGSAQLDVCGKLVVTTAIESGTYMGQAYATISGNGTAGYGGTVINIYPGAEVLNPFSSPLYIPQSGEVNISGGTIIGKVSAIGIKSGTLNISGGTIRATGPATIPTTGFSNGINGSGCAIQIESNSDYAGNVVVNITDGTISSLNGYALYEYIGKGAETKVTGITAAAPAVLQGSTVLGSAYLFSSDLADNGTVNFGGATLGNNATGESEVTANADVTYTVIIPASVDFGTINKSMGTQTKPFAVSVENALFEYGHGIKVTNTTDDEYMVMRDGNGTGTRNTLAFDLSAESFSFAGDGTQTGSVSCEPSQLTAAGSYKGYMTFSIEDIEIGD